MARASMAQLIALVRDLIGDPAGAQAEFSDDKIERALDFHRRDLRNAPLKPLSSPTTSEYRDWYSEDAYWEENTILTNEAGAILTPSQNWPLNGHWSFLTGQNAVYAHGANYDPYAAAADLLEMWAARVALEYDVVADGTSLHRSQKHAALKRLAAEYRAMRRITISRQVRDDIQRP